MKWMSLCAVVLSAACVTACAKAPATETAATQAAGVEAAQSTSARDVAVSADYPALSLPTIDGGQFDLAAHRGKWMVVNFWATWCAPCIKEMPELSALDARRKDVGVVGLAYEETDAEALKAFLAQRPVSYPIVIADPYDPPADFATPRGLPLTFLIAPDGRLAEQFLGPVTGGQIEAAIAALSAGN